MCFVVKYFEMANLNITNILIILAIVLSLVVVYFYFQIYKKKEENSVSFNNYKKIEYELEGNKYDLLVAESASQWQKGLMYVRKPVDFDGMIFKSSTTSLQMFWNKNTFEDLDVYWLKKGEIVGKSFLPSIEKEGLKTVTSPGMADTVIEIIR